MASAPPALGTGCQEQSLAFDRREAQHGRGQGFVAIVEHVFGKPFEGLDQILIGEFGRGSAGGHYPCGYRHVGFSSLAMVAEQFQADMPKHPSTELAPLDVAIEISNRVEDCALENVTDSAPVTQAAATIRL